MSFPRDPGVLSVVRQWGLGADDLLGHGGEAWVYALGDDRVLRILHPGGRARDIARRERLVAELRRAGPPFDLPEVLEVGRSAGRVFTIERRLPGRTVLDELASAAGDARRHLVEAYLDAAAALGDLHLGRRPRFGDLMGDDAITTSTWPDYLARRAAANLARSAADLRSIDPSTVTEGLPDAAGPAFVHLDAFPGNMLTDGTGITAVIDFGSTSVVGDRRFDPLCAAIYLASPEITPTATEDDVEVIMRWLGAAGLDRWLHPARRWLAAYWSFAVDDLPLLTWCRRVLLDHDRPG